MVKPKKNCSLLIEISCWRQRDQFDEHRSWSFTSPLRNTLTHCTKYKIFDSTVSSRGFFRLELLRDRAAELTTSLSFKFDINRGHINNRFPTAVRFLQGLCTSEHSLLRQGAIDVKSFASLLKYSHTRVLLSTSTFHPQCRVLPIGSWCQTKNAWDTLTARLILSCLCLTATIDKNHGYWRRTWGTQYVYVMRISHLI